MSTYPTRQADYSSTRAGAVIGKSLTVIGQINGKEDLVLDGRLEGDVDLPENRLTIGPTGHLQGRARAREIVIHGAVQGNLEASERVEAMVGLAIAVFSKTVRAEIRGFLSRNFYRSKYDYRAQWLQVTDAFQQAANRGNQRLRSLGRRRLRQRLV